MAIAKNQLIGLVKLIISADGTEDQINEWIKILEDNVPDPNVSGLIFHSKEELTAEEVVEKALAYRPIIL